MINIKEQLKTIEEDSVHYPIENIDICSYDNDKLIDIIKNIANNESEEKLKENIVKIYSDIYTKLNNVAKNVERKYMIDGKIYTDRYLAVSLNDIKIILNINDSHK